jgi:hypothetical protein
MVEGQANTQKARLTAGFLHLKCTQHLLSANAL